MISTKYLIFSITLLMISSCASFQSNSYSCKDLRPWMGAVLTLQGSVDTNSLRNEQIASLLAPAFNDAVFIKTFGKPYTKHSKNELTGIRKSLRMCYTQGKGVSRVKAG